MTSKKILIAGAFGTGNLGDDAILIGLLTELARKRTIVKDTIVVFSRNPHWTTFLTGVYATRKNPFDLLKSNEVIIGGGLLFGNVAKMALKYSILGLAAKLLGKRVIFYAVGVSAVKSPLGRLLMIISLNLADEISVRDSKSRERLIGLGVKKTIMLKNDPAFCLEPISDESAYRLLEEMGIRLNRAKILVGVTSQHIHDEELNNRTHNFLLYLLRRILTEYNDTQFIFVPFCNHIDSRKDKDVIYGNWLRKQLNDKKFVVLNHQYTPNEVMGILGLLDIVISTRLHPLILAYRTNTTAIGVDISEKINSFCGQYNLPIITINELDESYCLIKKIIDRKLREKVATESTK